MVLRRRRMRGQEEFLCQYIRAHTHSHTHIYIYTHIHTYTHTHIHIYTYTHTHTHTHTYRGLRSNSSPMSGGAPSRPLSMSLTKNLFLRISAARSPKSQMPRGQSWERNMSTAGGCSAATAAAAAAAADAADDDEAAAPAAAPAAAAAAAARAPAAKWASFQHSNSRMWYTERMAEPWGGAGGRGYL